MLVHQSSRGDDFGKLLIRLAVGGLMLFHGISKIRAYSETGVIGIEGMLEAKGLPAYAAYGIFVGEVLAPILILIGFLTRFGGLVVALTMVAAVMLAHPDNLFDLGPGGAYALEINAFYFLGGLALLFMGAGRYSLSRGQGPFD